MTLIFPGALPPQWRAGMAWCDAPRDNAGARAFFRRAFTLDAAPITFRLFVSADSRYRLFVNGHLAGRGPLKGTLQRYAVEEYEIASLLRAGRNVLAADVVWFGYNPPLSEEHSGFAGFLLQGPEGVSVETPGEWKALGDTSTAWDRTPYTPNAHLFLAGLERVDGALFPFGWERPDYDDSAWTPATLAVPLAAPGGDPDADLVWNFAPRALPALMEEPRRFVRTLLPRPDGLAPTEHRFAPDPAGWRLGAGEGGEIVLDAGSLATGYPTLEFAGGDGRTVGIVYGESVMHRTEKPDDGSPYLWGGGGRLCKGVRDALDGALIHGYQDTLALPGGPFSYEPHHWRTFWFVKIVIAPGPTEVTLRDAGYRFTTYPQRLQASFAAPSEPDMSRLWDVSWRTLQLCSHETYEDCPGYEQLNYLFDARNEALTSLAMAGETTLPRHTIALFRDTLRPDGLLASRTPSQLRQTIPIFALWWVQMVLDYWDWVGERDRAFVNSCLIAADAVVAFFRGRLRDDGFVGSLPYWNPIGGEDAPGTDLDAALEAGGSTYATALLLMALEAAQRLHRETGWGEDAERWEPTRARLQTALASAWSDTRGLFVERIERPDAPVSQHTQAMAILAGAATPEQARRAADAIAAGACAAPMTRQQGLPFAQAMRQAGHYGVAAAQFLAEYRAQLALGLTTWLEGAAEGRSDCHAWSAWLPVELLTSVLGIRPARPGFAEILIAPEPVFPAARGTLPTVVGDVAVSCEADVPRRAVTRLEAATPPGIPVVVRLPGRAPQRFPDGGSIRIEP